MNQFEKFYTLDPQFYEGLSIKTPSSVLDPTQSNQKLNEIDFQYKLKKAVSSWHTHLLFDEMFLENKNLENYIRWTQKSRIAPVLLVLPSAFPKYKKKLEKLAVQFSDRLTVVKKTLKRRLSQDEGFNLEFHFVCEGNDFPIEELNAFKNKASLVYVVTKKNRSSFLKEALLTSEIENYQAFFLKKYFYFPYKTHFRDSFLTARQVYHFLEKSLKFPPYPVDIYDRRIPKDIDLAPLSTPFFESSQTHSSPFASSLSAPSSLTKKPAASSLEEEIYFSVVIPCYNSGEQLLNTLNFLARQDFFKNQYEVIVVDDGSPHPIRQSLISFSKKNPSMNIKGIYLPRVVEKMKESARFRAGLARNLGVKHSRGKYLVFLDSDILAPPDYLTRLKKEHERADLILVKRLHLNKSFLSFKGELKPDELFSKVNEGVSSNFFRSKEKINFQKAEAGQSEQQVIKQEGPNKSKSLSLGHNRSGVIKQEGPNKSKSLSLGHNRSGVIKQEGPNKSKSLSLGHNRSGLKAFHLVIIVQGL